MESSMYHRVRISTLIVLVLALNSHINQEFDFASYSRVYAQKISSQSGQSKTNELISSKFRESISQFRRKLQPISQQRITTTNEQQVIEQQQQQNQILEQQQISSRQQQVAEQSYESQQQSIDSSSESLYGSVKGTPGVDFPNYSTIPNTKFSCDGVPFEPGMYADEATGCQVYHLCYQGRRESFLCGVGTVFNQAIMNCDFWHSVDCSKSSQYYGLNVEFGKSSSEPSGNIQSFSQSSVSQFEQAQIPVNTVQQQQLQVVKSHQSSYVAPKPPTIFRNEENYRTFQQTSGKVSPPRQQFSSNFVSQSTSGGTKSAPSSSLYESQDINLQRSNGFLSPGRKVAQLSGQPIVQQQQFASAESSPMRSFTSGETKSTGRAQQQAKLDVPSVNTDNNPRKSSSFRQFENSVDVGGQGRASASSSSAKQGLKSTKNSSSVGTKAAGNPISDASGGDAWKPYFRTKTKSGNKPVSDKPVAPVHHGATSSVAPETSEKNQASGGDGVTTPESPPPTLAQPDHEPTFSSDRESSTTEAPSDDVPSIPKSSAPPPSPTSTEEPVTNESPAVIESGNASELSATSPADSVATSENPTTMSPADTTVAPSSVESPQTTTTAAPTTTTAAAESPSTETASPSTEAAPNDSTMTTTASPETTAAATTTQQAGDEPSAMTTVASESAATPEEEKKKKRALVAGVDYAGPKRKVATSLARTNSSSVVYANSGRSRSTRKPK